MPDSLFDYADIKEYSSPLELLDHIISKHRADLFNLPIAEISRHYIEVLRISREQGLDMNLASEFIVMAASLMEMKAAMLLPDEQEQGPQEERLRQDLVLQLMAYRRMKRIALELEQKHRETGFSFIREPLNPEDLALSIEIQATPLDREAFFRGIENLEYVNSERYSQQNIRIKRLLRRENFSVSRIIKRIFSKIKKKARLFFSELFAGRKSPKAERIAGFLAILEMAQKGEVDVEQKESFGDILIKASNEEGGE